MRKGMKAALYGIISAFILSWGTFGATAAFAASSPAQTTSFKLRTPFAPTMAYSPFYVAQSLYWPKLNLDGTALPGKGSAVATQTVASGSEQMGYAGIVSLLNAIQQGLPIKILAVIERRDPTGIVFMKDSGIKELKDLVGKRVGNFAGGATGSLLLTTLRRNGIDDQKVRMVNVPPGGHTALLLERKVDAVAEFAGAGDVWMRCQGHDAVSIPLSKFGLELYGAAVFVNTKWADQVGDDVVARALLGIIQGATLVKQDSERALGILQKLNPQVEIDRYKGLSSVAAYVRWMWHPESPVVIKEGLGWIDKGELAKTQKVLVESGLLKKEIDVGAYYTTKYLKDPRVHQAAMEMARTPWPAAPDDVKKKCGL